MRKILIAAGVVCGVFLIAVAALFLFVDVNQFRGQIQSALQKQLGREVSLGQMKLQVIPLAIRVADVQISEDPNFQTGRPFATASEIRVRIALLPLLRKNLQVQSFILSQPSIELVRNSAKRWNYESIAGQQGGGSSGGLALDTFGIEDGRVAVSEFGVKNSRTEYNHIDLLLRDLAPGKPFHAKLSAHLEGSAKDSITLEGDGGPIRDKGAPFKGRLTINEASLGAVQRFLDKGKPPSLDGLLTATADIDGSESEVKVRGRMELNKVRLQGTELKAPLRMDYDLQDNLTSGVLHINSMKIGVDKVPLTASGEVNTKTNALDVTLRTTGADLADIFTLAHLAGVKDVSGSGTISLDLRLQGTTDAPSYSGDGRVQNASLQISSLTKPVRVQSATLKFDRNTANIGDLSFSLGSTNAKGELSVRNFSAPELAFRLDADKLNVVELQQLSADTKQDSQQRSSVTGKGTIRVGTLAYNEIVFQNVQAECTLTRDSISLSPIAADLFGGKQTGSITVDTRTKPPTVTLNTKLDGVDANQVLSATTPVKKVLYGLLAAQGNATMRLASTDKELARGLNGNLNLNLTKGRLAGVNLLNEMASIAKFLGYTQRNEGFTNIVQLMGDVAIRDGIASTSNLQMLLESGSVAASGTVNLVDQTLNLHLTTVLDRATSEKSGGTGIGGFLSTALANPKGELVIPAIVTGTFAQPRFAPDAARVAELKMKGILPGGAGKAVMDAITGKGQQTGQTPAGSLLDMLNSLKKKKPDQK